METLNYQLKSRSAGHFIPKDEFLENLKQRPLRATTDRTGEENRHQWFIGDSRPQDGGDKLMTRMLKRTIRAVLIYLGLEALETDYECMEVGVEIGSQEDTYSCGPICVNAAAHQVLGVPLFVVDIGQKAAQRSFDMYDIGDWVRRPMRSMVSDFDAYEFESCANKVQTLMKMQISIEGKHLGFEQGYSHTHHRLDGFDAFPLCPSQPPRTRPRCLCATPTSASTRSL